MGQHFDSVVIWGHKPKSRDRFGFLAASRHTHSYIHEGFYRAFRNLGYNTFWFDESTNIDGFDFSNTLFLTEDQVQVSIPLISTATYVLHHTPNEKYLDAGAKVLNLCNYVNFLESGKSFNYPSYTVSKLSELRFFDAHNKALYQPWATNLLPGEISADFVWKFSPTSRNVNYIGTTGHEDLPQRFKNFCKPIRRDGFDFKLYSSLDEITAQNYVENSRVSVDIRARWHIECGYIPCRIWKSLSYGKYIGSNSEGLREVFGDFVHFDSSESTLFHTTQEKYAGLNPKLSIDAMRWVQSHHTFINRAQSILEVLDLY